MIGDWVRQKRKCCEIKEDELYYLLWLFEKNIDFFFFQFFVREFSVFISPGTLLPSFINHSIMCPGFNVNSYISTRWYCCCWNSSHFTYIIKHWLPHLSPSSQMELHNNIFVLFSLFIFFPFVSHEQFSTGIFFLFHTNWQMTEQARRRITGKNLFSLTFHCLQFILSVVVCCMLAQCVTRGAGFSDAKNSWKDEQMME